jgi:hypothetical protein
MKIENDIKFSIESMGLSGGFLSVDDHKQAYFNENIFNTVH